MKILFSYSHQFGGHAKAAENIVEALNMYGIKDIRHFIVSKELLGQLSTAFSKIYIFIVKNIPEAWNLLWNNPAIGSLKNEIFDKSFYNTKPLAPFLKSLKETLDDFKPDIIVCTHALSKVLFS
ncbi:MAG: hypothetical protein NZ870_04775, partial [bacterium]|nr:hypothetical protein [bacterium]